MIHEVKLVRRDDYFTNVKAAFSQLRYLSDDYINAYKKDPALAGKAFAIPAQRSAADSLSIMGAASS